MTPIPAILISALILVESGGKNDAIGDDGRAHGCLQITQPVPDDIYRWTGHKVTLEDCHNRQTAVMVCLTYLSRYCSVARLGHEPTVIDWALTWNLGPQGPWRLHEPKAQAYLHKVNEAMKTLSAGGG